MHTGGLRQRKKTTDDVMSLLNVVREETRILDSKHALLENKVLELSEDINKKFGVLFYALNIRPTTSNARGGAVTAAALTTQTTLAIPSLVVNQSLISNPSRNLRSNNKDQINILSGSSSKNPFTSPATIINASKIATAATANAVVTAGTRNISFRTPGGLVTGDTIERPNNAIQVLLQSRINATMTREMNAAATAAKASSENKEEVVVETPTCSPVMITRRSAISAAAAHGSNNSKENSATVDNMLEISEATSIPMTRRRASSTGNGPLSLTSY